MAVTVEEHEGVPAQGAFTAADVVDLSLHRGAFETVLADEDKEQDPDRWYCHSACGQDFWQVISQWMWNLRLELGHRLHPTPLRTTEFAPAQPPSPCPAVADEAPSVTYGPPQWVRAVRVGSLAGADFPPQPDATLRCPAGQPLYPHERRPERDGTVRILYAARVGHCRPCPLRERCQGHGTATRKLRRVSAVLRPLASLPPSPAEPLPNPRVLPILWGDWDRCQTRVAQPAAHTNRHPHVRSRHSTPRTRRHSPAHPTTTGALALELGLGRSLK